MRLSSQYYSSDLTTAFGIIALCANIFLSSPWVGGAALIFWIFGITQRMLRWEFLGRDAIDRIFFGGILACSICVALFVGQMFSVGMYVPISVLTLFFSTCILYALPCKMKVGFVREKIHNPNVLWMGIGILADMLILALLLAARTEEPIISPWNFFSGELFILYFLATLLFLFGSREQENDLPLFAGMIHVFTTLSVSSLVFGMGFGFDPFVHRAAEYALTTNHFIEPRSVLYSGQYALVTGIQQVTAFSLKAIDIWLVPIFASLFLPMAGYIGLKDGWQTSKSWARIGWIGMFLFPFMLLTFSVPFTATYTWFMAMIFAVPAAKTRAKSVVLILGSGVMAFFHPLLAIPTGFFALLALFITKIKTQKWQRGVSIIVAIMSAGSVLAMFGIYQKMEGQNIVFQGLFTNAVSFLNLFRSPYANPYPFIPWYLNALYDFRYFFPMLAFGAAIGILLYKRKQHAHLFYMYGSLLIAILGSIYGLSTMFYFKNIIAHEQMEFALRLLTAWYAIALPIIVAFLGTLFEKQKLQKGIVLILSGVVTVSWFFSYPQFNSKYPYFSPSVSRDDVDAVQEIARLSEGSTYLVLANQMTSAAALQEFGFAKYIFLNGEKVLWYPIPTGGTLYAYYTRIILEGPSEEILQEIQKKTGVQKIYFLTYAYWPWPAESLEALQKLSTKIVEINNKKIIIYEYAPSPQYDKALTTK